MNKQRELANTNKMSTLSAIACDLTAIEAGKQDAHSMTLKQLISMAEDIQELPDGYAIHMPNDMDTFLQTAHFIASERQCCPFFNFEMELKAMNGPFWLRVTGQEEVKQFLQAELTFSDE